MLYPLGLAPASATTTRAPCGTARATNPRRAHAHPAALHQRPSWAASSHRDGAPSRLWWRR